MSDILYVSESQLLTAFDFCPRSPGFKYQIRDVAFFHYENLTMQNTAIFSAVKIENFILKLLMFLTFSLKTYIVGFNDLLCLSCYKNAFHCFCFQVAVLDVDICGPSIPRILGVEGEQVVMILFIIYSGSQGVDVSIMDLYDQGL